jgi:Domain amino terminal to FKBP-type peptidyl-prolyl isomerase.
MKSKIIAFGIALLALSACDMQQPRQAAVADVKIDSTTTDDQKFSYMLGSQFGGPSFKNIAMQLGEYFEIDYLVQGVLDNSKAFKDTAFKLQIPRDSMSAVDSYFAEQAAERQKLARPDSATEMSFEGDFSKLRAYVDSAMKTLPIKPAAKYQNVTVTIGEKTTPIQKYSYIMGTQLDIMFHGVERQFDQEFDLNYFIQGLREACLNVLDTNYKTQFPMDSIKAVNDRYVVKVREHMQKKREEFMKQQQAALDSAAAANDSTAKDSAAKDTAAAKAPAAEAPAPEQK